MSSKSTSSSAPKSSDGRKRAAAAHGRGNGRGNGNGNGNGNGASSRKHSARAAASDGSSAGVELLDGQPPIEALLGLARERTEKQLDKRTLLGALLAFRKGDFTARLPIELDGMD